MTCVCIWPTHYYIIGGVGCKSEQRILESGDYKIRPRLRLGAAFFQICRRLSQRAFAWLSPPRAKVDVSEWGVVLSLSTATAASYEKQTFQVFSSTYHFYKFTPWFF